MLFTGQVHALPFATPGPGVSPIDGTPITFGADLDDTGYFAPSSEAFSIELFDFGDSFGSPFAASAFGFYFEGADVTDVSNLHTIFPIIGAPAPQFARIDFGTGEIIDLDAGGIQNTFAGSGNIGFFLLPDPETALPILFTDPTLNGGSTDVSGTFPIISSPAIDDFLISFNIPGVAPLSFQIVSGVSPVPEPGTLLLLTSGLAGIGFYQRMRRKD
jgi:hypothetical protein